MVPPSPASSSPAAARRVVVVLGMHRSGTSAVSGCLHRLGIDFGPRLMPATADNPRGYFEHIDLVNLHDRLLLALGRRWDDTFPFPPEWWRDDALTGRFRAEAVGLLRRDFAATPLWGFKDPRLCRLLPWWADLWREVDSRPLFVLVRRSPREVAASLTRREGFSEGKSHLLWLQHVLEAERATRGLPRVTMDFKAFVANWRAALEPLCRLLGQEWPSPMPEAETTVARFVDPGLVHAAPTDLALSQVPAWLRQTDAALLAGVAGDEARMQTALDEVADSFREVETLFAPTRSVADADLQHQLEETRRQAAWYEAEWQKARARADDARAKLADKKRENEKLRAKVMLFDKT